MKQENIVSINSKKSLGDVQDLSSPDGLASMRTAVVTDVIGGSLYNIESTNIEPCKALRAAGCLLQPVKGDQVLCAITGDECFILSVLIRADGAESRINLDGKANLSIESEQLKIRGNKSVKIQSGNQISVTSLGEIRFNARNLFTTVTNSLMQMARYYLSRAENIDLKAKQLLCSRGRHQLITAEEDVKVDGERISMG